MSNISDNSDKTNRRLENCLRIIYNNKDSLFNALLEKDDLFLFMKGTLKLRQQKYSKLAKIKLHLKCLKFQNFMRFP